MRAFNIIRNIKSSKSSTLKEEKKEDDLNLQNDTSPEIVNQDSEEDVKDFNKRAFLRAMGLVGLGIFASSVFTKKAEAIMVGNQATSGALKVRNSSGTVINPAKEDGNLADVKTNTDPLTNSAAGAYVRQDSNATIAKESGGNLATIATNTAPLANLQLDGSNYLQVNVMSSNAAASSATKITDSEANVINPSTDESIIYLRRIVKLMESQATVDAANRQRVTVDAFTATNASSNIAQFGGSAVVTGTGVGGAGVPRVTVSSDSSVIIGNLATLAGQNQQMYQDVARNAYANGIRQNLQFT